jgi:hypothetical protein
MGKIEKKPLSVIDALSGGFELVARRPWVLLVPVALDLFLWLGPPITAQPVFQQMIALLMTASAQGAPPDTLQNLDVFTNALQTTGAKFNVFSFLALFAIGMPSLMSVDAPPTDLLSARAALFSIADGAALLGVITLLALAGIFLGSVYLEAIARSVRREAGSARTFAPRVLKSYVNITALIVLSVIGALLLMIPIAISATLASVLNQGLGSFLVIVGSLVILWAGLYLAFAIPAIFVSGSSVWQAVLNSIAVFRYNFWSAMGLIFLIYLLQMGFSVIWQQLLGSTWGVVIDVVANAFLGTGLVAAGMLFYYDRFTWLTEVRERIRQQQRPSLKG